MMNNANIFLSYSHRDSPLVGAVVKLLRLNTPAVFYDSDSIQPGEKWREQVDGALAQAQLIVLFWCAHARGSEEVRKEYGAALELRKKILPVLLDGTPLPSALREFQWIDFRSVARPNHRGLRRWVVFAAVLLIVLCAAFSTMAILEADREARFRVINERMKETEKILDQERLQLRELENQLDITRSRLRELLQTQRDARNAHETAGKRAAIAREIENSRKKEEMLEKQAARQQELVAKTLIEHSRLAALVAQGAMANAQPYDDRTVQLSLKHSQVARWLAFLMLVAGAVVLFVLLWRRRRKSSGYHRTSSDVQPQSWQHLMAEELKAEIMRRVL